MVGGVRLDSASQGLIGVGLGTNMRPNHGGARKTQGLLPLPKGTSDAAGRATSCIGPNVAKKKRHPRREWRFKKRPSVSVC